MHSLFALLAYGPEGWGDELVSGAFITIALALATLPFGLTFGLFVALLQRSSSRFLKRFATVFTTVFRGLPELLTLLIVYYGGQILLRYILRAIGIEADVEISSFVAGMIALGLVLAAFSSEVWLGAINSITEGQREAGRSLGLSNSMTFRLVVFPQLMRVALPGLSNNWLSLLKETSLVSTIALPDLMRETSLAVSVTKEPFFFYLAACCIYLFYSVVSASLFSVLENRANRGYAQRS